MLSGSGDVKYNLIRESTVAEEATNSFLLFTTQEALFEHFERCHELLFKSLKEDRKLGRLLCPYTSWKDIFFP